MNSNLTDEQIILLQNINMLYVPQPLEGIALLKCLQSAYQNVEHQWANTFMGCEINTQTNNPIVAYVPFPNKINKLLED